MEIKLFVATKAFILYENKILILKESSEYKDGTNVGQYDVAGGRIEPGENFNQTLLREVKEEAGLLVEIGKPFYVGEWRPIVKGEQWQVVGIFFECFSNSDKVKLDQDHQDYKWINPEDYSKYNLINNLKPVF